MCHAGYPGKAENVAVGAKGTPGIQEPEASTGIFDVEIT